MTPRARERAARRSTNAQRSRVGIARRGFFALWGQRRWPIVTAIRLTLRTRRPHTACNWYYQLHAHRLLEVRLDLPGDRPNSRKIGARVDETTCRTSAFIITPALQKACT
ncbi:hypothetical protein [Rhodovibrio salinarum]|uniref:hypothetical protein n=1 Tax=Rhodovibrio salinarum TaxID=1087 RepID=UPI0012DC2C63|nr:hypothetical protein [Rhodovibrio salinarum]